MNGRIYAQVISKNDGKSINLGCACHTWFTFLGRSDRSRSDISYDYGPLNWGSREFGRKGNVVMLCLFPQGIRSFAQLGYHGNVHHKTTSQHCTLIVIVFSHIDKACKISIQDNELNPNLTITIYAYSSACTAQEGWPFRGCMVCLSSSRRCYYAAFATSWYSGLSGMIARTCNSHWPVTSVGLNTTYTATCCKARRTCVMEKVLTKSELCLVMQAWLIVMSSYCLFQKCCLVILIVGCNQPRCVSPWTGHVSTQTCCITHMGTRNPLWPHQQVYFVNDGSRDSGMSKIDSSPVTACHRARVTNIYHLSYRACVQADVKVRLRLLTDTVIT